MPAALRDGRIVEAEGPLWRALVAACLDGTTLAGDGLVLTGTAGPVPAPVVAEDVRPLGIDQSNTSVVLGGRTVLKCYRRVAPGGHPEIELTRWLSGRGLACLPAVHGSATVSLGGGEPAGALLLQDFVADGRDGWLAAEAELGAFLDAGDPEAAASAPEAWAPGDRPGRPPSSTRCSPRRRSRPSRRAARPRPMRSNWPPGPPPSSTRRSHGSVARPGRSWPRPSLRFAPGSRSLPRPSRRS